jgi:hypothetical protein
VSPAAAIWDEIIAAARADAFLPVAAACFFAAVAQALATPWIARCTARRSEVGRGWKSSALHLLGEVEAVFAFWALALLMLALVWPGKGGAFVASYLGGGHEAAAGAAKFLEPFFVGVVMAMASTRPILTAARRLLETVARAFGGGPGARWFAVLTVAPLLGSLITEPAAMTIAASLLAERFYRSGPSEGLRYATLGLLFVNVSVGGALTAFAAPPVVMVAAKWGWGGAEVFRLFGLPAVVAVVAGNAGYFAWFRRELAALRDPVEAADGAEAPVPAWLIGLHAALIAGTVVAFSAHHGAGVAAGAGAFAVLMVATRRWQGTWSVRPAVMVGLFLAGLVVLGGLQAWWLGPVLARVDGATAMLASLALTSFNDNAAVTYLASTVPALAAPGAGALRQAIVAGALAGGGLTVIANAPNPAGQAILARFFPGGVSPWRLFLWAALPTAGAVVIFLLLG